MKINKNECHHIPLRGYIIKCAKEYERGFIFTKGMSLFLNTTRSKSFSI